MITSSNASSTLLMLSSEYCQVAAFAWSSHCAPASGSGARVGCFCGLLAELVTLLLLKRAECSGLVDSEAARESPPFRRKLVTGDVKRARGGTVLAGVPVSADPESEMDLAGVSVPSVATDGLTRAVRACVELPCRLDLAESRLDI
jgi:hypothetical protein